MKSMPSDTDLKSTRKARIYSKILLVAITFFTLLLFLPALHNSFTNWDDPEYILSNPLIRSLSSENIGKIFTTHLTGKYHPLTLLSFAVEYHFFQLNPFVYHLDNLLLHLLNVVLVFALIKMLFQNQDLALITALLFGIHPLHVEPVAWVVGRKDVLFTAFYLGSLLSYIYGIICRERSRPFPTIWNWVALILFLCALLSKAMAITLPLILLLIDDHLEGRITAKDIWQKIPFFLLTIVFALMTWKAEKSLTAFSASPLFAPGWRIPLSAHAILLYLGKIFLPFDLSAFYPLPTEKSTLIAASLVAAILFFNLYLVALKNQTLKFPLLFSLLTIAPVLHLIEINDSIIYDRFFYLPSIGIFLLLGQFFLFLFRNLTQSDDKRAILVKALFIFTLVFYLAILGAISYNRCLVWKNSESLWQDVIRKYPQAAVAYNNLASTYIEQKKNALAFRLLNHAIALAPNYAMAYYNRGNILAQQGYYQRALESYSKSITLDPGYLDAYNNRGNMFFFLQQYDLALADYDQLIILYPNHLQAHLNRGLFYFSQRDFDAALKDFSKVLEMDPNNPLANQKIKEINGK